MSDRFKPAGAFLIYVLGITLVAAILAPWVYWLVQWIAQAIDSAWLARQPFKRIFNRVILVAALAGMWPLWRVLSIRSWRDVGWVRDPAGWRHLFTGFGIGIVSFLVALGLIAVLQGLPIIVDISAIDTVRVLGKFMLIGCAVAVIEETFFRGGIQGALQHTVHPRLALIITSAVYAGVHFLKPVWRKDVYWWSGFDYVASMFTQAFQRTDVMVGFVTLFLVGCVLGCAFQRTRTLYMAIGLHAGLVWVNEFVRSLGWGQVRDCWEAWPVMVVALALVAWLTQHPRPAGEPPC